jgi:hypothetical protein
LQKENVLTNMVNRTLRKKFQKKYYDIWRKKVMKLGFLW